MNRSRPPGSKGRGAVTLWRLLLIGDILMALGNAGFAAWEFSRDSMVTAAINGTVALYMVVVARRAWRAMHRKP